MGGGSLGEDEACGDRVGNSGGCELVEAKKSSWPRDRRVQDEPSCRDLRVAGKPASTGTWLLGGGFGDCGDGFRQHGNAALLPRPFDWYGHWCAAGLGDLLCMAWPLPYVWACRSAVRAGLQHARVREGG